MKILTFVLLLLPWLCFAQQPSHYFIGQQELEGVDVYDILQTSDGDYMLATSNGLIQFDGYRFKNVGCADMLMYSVFNLIEDTMGNIFCHNLRGQVFKFGNGSCELLLTLPDSLVAADMSLAIDDLNRLIIGSNRLMVADESGSLQMLTEQGYYGPIHTLADASLVMFSMYDEGFLRLKKGILKNDTYFNGPIDGSEIPGLFAFGDSTYMYKSNTCEISRIRNGDAQLAFSPVLITGKEHIFKVYATTNALWFAANSLGVLRVDRQFNPSNNGEFLFPRTLISNVTEDAEGNVLLGTFGKGIIVIPNETTEDLDLGQLEEDIISVARSAEGILYFGTRSGKLLERAASGEVTKIRDVQVKSMEALFVLGNGQLLIGELNGVLLNLRSGAETNVIDGSIKDIAFIDADKVLVGCNNGASILEISSGEVEKIPELMIRHYRIGYDPKTGSIYSGTSKGFMIRNKSGDVRMVKLRGEDVIVRDFLSKDGKVLAATAENGILIFKDDTLITEWNTSTGLAANQLTQLAVYNDKWVVATSKGIQLLDGNGNVIRTINQADGLNATKILDLEVNGDELWVVHSIGVQKVMLDAFQPFTFQPTLTLKQVLVNDSLTASLTQHDFSPEQQKFTFEVSANSLRYRNEITYQYRLEGAETAWHSANFSDNIIEYRSLSSGTYTFRAKSVCRNQESEEVTYTFNIATPFYKAWWFYALISLGLVSLVVLWFRRRLKRQQFLAQQQNELNASKLTAIQSQMNPHFIFNALNSIQDLVLKGDVTNSYSYITKFADLVRRTLSYSDKEFIDFESEIKLIELYLTLEKLRFKTDFDYEIETSGIDGIQIPPMLIQPFIENALVHGLLHKEGHRQLKLSFKLDENLTCIITDNGIGRAKAKEIKERQRSSHPSFSVNAIKTRFEILQRYFDGNLGFKYDDLFEGGVVVGTSVTLIIPVKRQF